MSSSTQVASAGKRVLVVDDEPLFRRAVAEILKRQGFSVESAGTVSDACAALAAGAFDALLLDVVLPDGSAEDVLAHVESLALPRVALITGSYDGDRWLRLASSCDLLVPKPISLKAVAEIAQQLCKERKSEPTPCDVKAFVEHFRLSPKEQQILALAVAGANDKEAAATLECSRGTIATHWQRIFKKTHQHSQRDVIASILRFSRTSVINM